jgi:hypothetical protein
MCYFIFEEGDRNEEEEEEEQENRYVYIQTK